MWPPVGPKQDSSTWYQQKEMGEGAWRGAGDKAPRLPAWGAGWTVCHPRRWSLQEEGHMWRGSFCHMAGVEGCRRSVRECAEQESVNVSSPCPSCGDLGEKTVW